jgi:hypothetical protein
MHVRIWKGLSGWLPTPLSLPTAGRPWEAGQSSNGSMDLRGGRRRHRIAHRLGGRCRSFLSWTWRATRACRACRTRNRSGAKRAFRRRTPSRDCCSCNIVRNSSRLGHSAKPSRRTKPGNLARRRQITLRPASLRLEVRCGHVDSVSYSEGRRATFGHSGGNLQT